MGWPELPVGANAASEEIAHQPSLDLLILVDHCFGLFDGPVDGLQDAGYFPLFILILRQRDGYPTGVLSINLQKGATSCIALKTTFKSG